MDYITKAVLEDTLKSVNKELETWVAKANHEISNAKNLNTETKGALETLSEKASGIVDRLLALEQKSVIGVAAASGAPLSVGEQFAKQEAFAGWQAKQQGSLRMEVKAAIINAPLNGSQPLVAGQRVPGIVASPDRALTVRDLLPVGTTGSNLVQFTRELVFSNAAAAQNGENTAKAESGITFELADAPVVTLAHWVPVSKQVLADAPQLQSYINTRLMYGLKLVEENQLLNGLGTSGTIGGLLKTGNFTAYNRAVVNDTRVDTLRRAITQCTLSNYAADAIVLNPVDWEAIELQKETTGGYVWTNPAVATGPQIWGRRVVATTAIAAGKFLTGSFTMGAQIWDRQEAAVQVSFENADNFTKNMATILAEERLALTVYRPSAFVSGDFA